MPARPSCTTRSRVPGLAGAAALALVATASLSGCGASQQAADAAATSPAAGASSAAVCTGRSDDKASAPTQLTLALVPSGDASKLVETVKPLEQALSQRLGIPVKGVITQDYQAAVEAIGSGQAQIGMLPSLQMSQACEKYGAVPALQSERKGKSTYAAQFFTNDPAKYCADQPVAGADGMLFCNGTQSGEGPAGLDELPKIKGATVSLLQPASPAGYIFPVAAMKKAGIDVSSDIKVTQVTANDASVLAVYNGDAQVGTSYWDARSVVAKDTPDVGQKVVVFALTDAIPNDGVSLSSGLSQEWQTKVAAAMKDYAATPEGQQALSAIYQITGLRDADPAALQKTSDVAASIGLG
ncbi:phosphate/phosphite/phosphonate ABC transporter substrate-binding protein [Quadrisphaera oryzae]|uniref:phosphate/phosphite/phosphonate ABC transporter substrate-binding protein n=1 Tax=Quadrisphaera TaxID=317661 RepID=UPI001644DD4D|nr:phosphate/phosphite/phosphonate ABC transporter substrate-binding protein [Quadrisphaera sp. RL12-1S]MBC3763392.1 phosphate/phosphite/phosphonate ABC transporter substrate-binding protein [Quadrisphaera sp. RL12-1S]